jgi:xanthine dehydrogenase molybdopterin-binding subunit B
MAGTLHAAFFRSLYAHARITRLHIEAARQHPRVVAILTGNDILGKVGTIPCRAATPGWQHQKAVWNSIRSVKACGRPRCSKRLPVPLTPPENTGSDH